MSKNVAIEVRLLAALQLLTEGLIPELCAVVKNGMKQTMNITKITLKFLIVLCHLCRFHEWHHIEVVTVETGYLNL
jgi:hypothetical protein